VNGAIFSLGTNLVYFGLLAYFGLKDYEFGVRLRGLNELTVAVFGWGLAYKNERGIY
jgi:hypothetical protein